MKFDPVFGAVGFPGRIEAGLFYREREETKWKTRQGSDTSREASRNSMKREEMPQE
jgi:hypothetical protein